MSTPARKPAPARVRRINPAAKKPLARQPQSGTTPEATARDWFEYPHCNLPLRHPAWKKLDPAQRRTIWRGLAHALKPLSRLAYVPLGNFKTDLPFLERRDFLHTSLLVLLGEDFESRMLAGEITVPDHIDSYANDDGFQTMRKELWLSWQSYHAHELADYNRGVADAEQLQEFALEDAINYSVRRIPDDPRGRFECIPCLSSAYLEGLASKGKIRWVSALQPEYLFSLFNGNNPLRRIVFGKYANADFTLNDVLLKFGQR